MLRAFLLYYVLGLCVSCGVSEGGLSKSHGTGLLYLSHSIARIKA